MINIFKKNNKIKQWNERGGLSIMSLEQKKQKQDYFLFVSQLACIMCWTDLDFSPASAKLWQRFLSRTDANAAAANQKQRR